MRTEQTRERLYLFDTTLRGPLARSRVTGEHEQAAKRRRAGTNGGDK